MPQPPAHRRSELGAWKPSVLEVERLASARGGTGRNSLSRIAGEVRPAMRSRPCTCEQSHAAPSESAWVAGPEPSFRQFPGRQCSIASLSHQPKCCAPDPFVSSIAQITRSNVYAAAPENGLVSENCIAAALEETIYCQLLPDARASAWIPWIAAQQRKGWIQDRRPNANMDPHHDARMIRRGAAHSHRTPEWTASRADAGCCELSLRRQRSVFRHVACYSRAHDTDPAATQAAIS